MVVSTLDEMGRDVYQMYMVYQDGNTLLEHCILADDENQIAYEWKYQDGRLTFPPEYEIRRGNITIWKRHAIENGAFEYVNMTLEARSPMVEDFPITRPARRIRIRRNGTD